MKHYFSNTNYLSRLILITSLSLAFSEITKANINSQLSIFQDTTPPVPFCLTGVITLPIPITGSITINAKDLDHGSFDNITPHDKLKFYFDGDRLKKSITIRCSDFLAAGAHDELVVKVQMWVEDEAGNSDYCTTALIIQDNKDVCPNDSAELYPYYLKGRISCTLGNRIDGGDCIAKITLTGPNGFYQEKSSSPYTFVNLDTGTYTLCIEKNDNPLNGVTTADIVKIQRHILGIEPLNSPYKLLAADVNNTKTITASDIMELKKLILGIKATFSKVPSWIFIPSDYIFLPNVIPDAKQFVPYCKTIEIKDKSLDNVDFIGIKMGDVTGNARTHN